MQVDKSVRPFVWKTTTKLESEDAGEIAAQIHYGTTFEALNKSGKKRRTRAVADGGNGLDGFQKGMALIEKGSELISEGMALVKGSVPWVGEFSEFIQRLKAT